MSEQQKSAFEERLKRIARDPGNGRMVTPGAFDEVAEAARSKKGKRGRAPQIAQRKKDRKPRIGLGWFYGLVAGFVMFLAWVNLYPAMSTPRLWGGDALPVPPQTAAIWIGAIVVAGLLMLRQADVRVAFVMLIGMVMGGAVLAGIAALLPDLGLTLTNETFVAQIQEMVGQIELE